MCDEPILGEIEHHFHNEDCPNRKWEDGGDDPTYAECQCDNPCHPWCCPICNKEKK